MEMKWNDFLQQEQEKEYFIQLMNFIEKEYQEKTIYPTQENIFSVFDQTEFSEIKVVILGQDPYHGENQAHGLCFSVQKGVDIPPSLKNIYKELHTDLDYDIPTHGCLLSWANQGVFLLNTILTVEKGMPLSHQDKGWEIFTDKVICEINNKSTPVVFVLWGANARQKKKMITNPLHKVIEAPHPSPLSAYRGFFGSKPFSKINQFLKERGIAEIDWEVKESDV